MTKIIKFKPENFRPILPLVASFLNKTDFKVTEFVRKTGILKTDKNNEIINNFTNPNKIIYLDYLNGYYFTRYNTKNYAFIK